MQIISDRGDQDLTGLLLDGEDERLQRILAGLPKSARNATEHSDDFWIRQRTEIRSRIATPAPRPACATLAWASVLALALLVMLFPIGHSAPGSSRTGDDPDQELLVAVEQAVQDDVPESLSPAALLADEIIGNTQPISTSSGTYKENQNASQ